MTQVMETLYKRLKLWLSVELAHVLGLVFISIMKIWYRNMPNLINCKQFVSVLNIGYHFRLPGNLRFALSFCKQNLEDAFTNVLMYFHPHLLYAVEKLMFGLWTWNSNHLVLSWVFYRVSNIPQHLGSIKPNATLVLLADLAPYLNVG